MTQSGDFELVTVESEEGPVEHPCYHRIGVWAAVEDEETSMVVHVPTGLVAHTEAGEFFQYTSDEAIWLVRLLGASWPDYGAELGRGSDFRLTDEIRQALVEWEKTIEETRAALVH